MRLTTEQKVNLSVVSLVWIAFFFWAWNYGKPDPKFKVYPRYIMNFQPSDRSFPILPAYVRADCIGNIDIETWPGDGALTLTRYEKRKYYRKDSEGGPWLEVFLCKRVD